MTAQVGERLRFKGEETWMATEPLNQYLQNRDDINFVPKSSACWRGYYGQWEIKDNKLFLIGLKAYVEEYREVDLHYLFPGQNQVFANWFSGGIRIPQGEMLEYVHMGYFSIFERDLVLKFSEGILIDEKQIDNRKEFEKHKIEREINPFLDLKNKLINKKKTFWDKLFRK